MPEELLFEETMKEAAGFFSNQERGVSFPLERIAEVQDLVFNSRYQGTKIAPHWRDALVREALTTADFPLLFGDVLDRQMLAAYRAVEPAWKMFTKMSTVNKVKTDAYRFTTYGGDDNLAPVAEKGEYLASPRDELRYIISVIKRGRQFDISWESLINDDLGALRDTPARFARAAMRTEHRLITALYASDVGAHVEGNGGNLYAVGTNAAAALLSIASLQVGVQTMNMFTDIPGEPIMATPRFLVVPPALEYTALAILNSTTIVATTAAGVPFPATNVIQRANLELVVDKYLPVVNIGNDQHTQWYLFSDPAEIAALEAAHLTGHEEPEIAMKASDKVSISGGPVSPFEGDFATDNVFYRVRSIFGGTKLDWRATYMGGYLA